MPRNGKGRENISLHSEDQSSFLGVVRYLRKGYFAFGCGACVREGEDPGKRDDGCKLYNTKTKRNKQSTRLPAVNDTRVHRSRGEKQRKSTEKPICC